MEEVSHVWRWSGSTVCVGGLLSVLLSVSCATLEDVGPVSGVRRLATGMGFTEGPVWLPEEQALVFSDIPSGLLMRWSEADGLTTFEERPNPNGNLLDREGRLLTCQHGARNLVRREHDGSLTVLADTYEGKRLNSPNDVAVDSAGVLWFTDPPWGLPQLSLGKQLDGQFVFRLDPRTGALEAVLRGHAMPNGIAISPDGLRLYVADTGGHPRLADASLHDRPATLSAYSIVGQRLTVQPVWSVETVCDGMCIDERGNIYATGESVTIWSPEGLLLGSIEVPEQPANVCFGGDDGRTLFITARTSLYAVDMNAAGAGF
ncbi:MAG: SMP-30/gluconolactonase/LRE family protein [Planctomycetota bacterium]